MCYYVCWFSLRGTWGYCHTCGSGENASTVHFKQGHQQLRSLISVGKESGNTEGQDEGKSKCNGWGEQQNPFKDSAQEQAHGTHIPFLLNYVALLLLQFILFLCKQELWNSFVIFFTHFSGNCNSLILIYSYWNNINLHQF